MGSKRWTWVLNLLKSFGSQTWDLGLDSNKVIKTQDKEIKLKDNDPRHMRSKS